MVEPKLVCECAYSWTRRRPAPPDLHRPAPDKQPEEIHREGKPMRLRVPRTMAMPPRRSTTPATHDVAARHAGAPPATAPRRARFALQLRKTFGRTGYTKAPDRVLTTPSPHYAAYLRDRPAVLTRYRTASRGSRSSRRTRRSSPGLDRTESSTPRLRREIRSSSSTTRIAALRRQPGTIPIHMWSSRPALERPTGWCWI